MANTDMDILRRASEMEKRPRAPGLGINGAWEYFTVGASKEDIKRLLEEGLIEIIMRNTLMTKYKLTAKGNKLVWAVNMEKEMEKIPTETVLEAMSLVIGFDDIKEALARAIETRRKVNFLLEGPPATAKSLILEAVRSVVPHAYMAFGSRTSGSGLSDALFEHQPEVLLIDEADKMSMDVFSVMLGLMESGEIIETKSKKALRNGTNVYTPTGPRAIETLMVGELVFTVEGDSAPVLGVFPQGKVDIYEITLSDGQVIPCTLDHLWEIERSHYKAKVIETSELLKISPRSLSRTWIPVAKAVRFLVRPVPLDPYALGALLGNGGLTRETLQLSTTEGVDDPVLKRVAAVAPDGYSFKQASGEKNWRDFTLTRDFASTHKYGAKNHPWITILRELGLWGKYSYEKFIPEIYKYNGEEVRWALIQGLMDTDGSADDEYHYGQPRYSTSSLRLANDLAEVVESLGGLCSVGPPKPISYLNKQTGLRVPCKPAYSVRITHPDATKFFLIARKKNLTHKKMKPMRRYIDNVRFVGQDEATCIKIDHPRELFLTEGFIPTHNTRGIKLRTTVIAACNSSAKMPREFLSRFALHVRFPEYTRDEFIDVCRGFLSRAENAPPDIATFLGEQVFDNNIGDVRKARGAWLLMAEPTEAEASGLSSS